MHVLSPTLRTETYAEMVFRLAGEGLIGFYQINETGNPTTVQDISGRGHHAPVLNAANGLFFGADSNPWPDTPMLSSRATALPASCIDLYASGLPADFNGQEGSLLVWLAINDPAVWTDGDRFAVSLLSTDQVKDSIGIYKTALGRIYISYLAGGVSKASQPPITYDQGLYCAGMTWSLSAPPTGEAHFYLRGWHHIGYTGLGTWTNPLRSDAALIGSDWKANSLTWVWKGTIGPVIFWNRALPRPVMEALGVSLV